MAGTYRSIGKQYAMVGWFAQNFVGKNISRLAIPTWVETIVYEVKLRIDAVETVGKEELHCSEIPAYARMSRLASSLTFLEVFSRCFQESSVQ